jgi:hypothetical protein
MRAQLGVAAMPDIFVHLGFSEDEEIDLVERAKAAYAKGQAIQVPSAKNYQAKLKKAKQAARRLQAALDDLPDMVVAAVRNATLEDGTTPAYPPGGDPITQLAEGTANLSTFTLAFNAYSVSSVEQLVADGQRVGILLQGRRLTKPQRRDFGTNLFIAVVAEAYRQKTGRQPTFSIDAMAYAPERGGPFAHLLRAIVARSGLGLDPDTVVRKAALLREAGSI